MLHLRVVSPSSLTDAVLEALDSDPAVTALTVVRGAAVRPVGDVVEADVAREAANDIVDRLVNLGVQREGTLHLDEVTTWISRPGFDADRRTPGSSALCVVTSWWSRCRQTGLAPSG